MTPHLPWKTLLFLTGIGVLSVLLSSVWPAFLTEDLNLKFADTSIYSPFPDQEESLDVNALLQSYQQDSIAIAQQEAAMAEQDSIAAALAAEAARKAAFERLQIQFSPEDSSRLNAFFEAIKAGEALDILHYGDSQIEGDRITGYLRNQWQKRWGGTGPGLVPIVEAVPSAAIKMNSEGFARYALFGNAEKPDHSRFGMLASMSQKDSSAQIASTTFAPSPLTYWHTKQFNEAKIFYGAAKDTSVMTVKVNGSIYSTDSIYPSERQNVKSISVADNIADLSLQIEGGIGPEMYALDLRKKGGVHVHNLAMRGSSGTIFKKISKSQLSFQYGQLNPKLVLLQYGGNSVPYVKDKEQADRYGNWFASQIRRLQELMPEACFIVIGPSDMAHKVDGKFITYEYLSEVRDALKNAAFDTGCGFWDIYEVMGGENSMKSWVNADPALAGADHVHFTNKGAKEIGKLFDQALMEQQKLWAE